MVILTHKTKLMKTLLALLFVLPATVSLADVAIYNGAQVVKTTALDDTSTVVRKFVQVVDLTESKLVTISLEITKGKKLFYIGTPAAVVKTQVQSSRGNHKSSTVLAQALTSTDATTGVVTVTSFLQQGVDGQVLIKGTEKTALPRNLQGVGSSLTTAGTAVPPAVPTLVEIKQTLVLQDKTSKVSNDAGDTLSAAVNRVKDDLIAHGFGDGSVVPPP